MNLSDRITDADEACRSSEISVNLIIIIVFLYNYSYFCYILTSFFGVVVLHFRRLYIYINFRVTCHFMRVLIGLKSSGYFPIHGI
jgi:hypothetical protein